MANRVEEQLRTLEQVGPSDDLWDRALEGPRLPEPSAGPRRQIAVGIVALLVVLPAALFTWRAFSIRETSGPNPSGPAAAANPTPSCSPATTGITGDISTVAKELTQALAVGDFCRVWGAFGSQQWRSEQGWSSVSDRLTRWVESVGPLRPGDEPGELTKLGWTVPQSGPSQFTIILSQGDIAPLAEITFLNDRAPGGAEARWVIDELVLCFLSPTGTTPPTCESRSDSPG
jgi:hypothetical protein